MVFDYSQMCFKDLTMITLGKLFRMCYTSMVSSVKCSHLLKEILIIIFGDGSTYTIWSEGMPL